MDLKPGYKRTEVGVIPQDWEVAQLKAITTQIGDGLHGTPIYTANGSYPFINGNNLSAGKIVITNDTKSVAYPEFAKYKSPLSDRSILISINGTIGNVALYDGAPILLGKSVAFMNIKPHLSRLFIYHSLQTLNVREQFFGGLTGSTIGNLGLATIRGTEVPLPQSEAEQCVIAEALGDVDALLDGLDRLIRKKRDLKQATMQQLLTGQTRLPGFNGEWQEGIVQDVILRYFCGPSPTCQERNIDGDFEWGVLKTTAATKENGWHWKAHKVLPKLFWNKPHLEVREGDVIVTKAGPRHRVGVAVYVEFVPRRLIVSGKMIGLRPNPIKIVPLMLASAISA